MKIAVIEPVGGHGGMNYYDVGLAEGFLALKAHSVLYTCDETREVSVKGFQIRKFFKGIYGKKNKFVRFFNFLTGLIHSAVDAKLNGHSFIHLHFFHYGALELLMCGTLRLFGFSIIATVHDVESFAGADAKWMQKMIFGLCRRLVVHNEYSRSVLLGVVPDHLKISVIRHGNYRDFVKRVPKAQAKSSLGLNPDAKVILFFGQIKKVKGLHLLIDAFSKIAIDDDRLVLLIAGKVWKTDFAEYQDLIDKKEISSKVIARIEYIPDEEVHLYYNAADIVALPYMQIFQSGVLLMSMSYERPVVASDLLPMKEIVNEPSTGYLFRTGSSDDLAEKLSTALQADLSALGAAAGRLMDEEYSWDEIAKLYIEEYKKL